MSEEPSFRSHIARLREVSSFFFFSTGKMLNTLKQITFQMGELARTQLDYYYTFYWVGFGAWGILFFVISNVNRHTNWFILRSILGIEEKKKDHPKSVVLCANCRNYITTKEQSNINEQISQHLKNCNHSNRMANSSKSNVDHPSEKKQDILSLEKYLFIEREDDEDAGPQLKCFVRVFSDFLTSLFSPSLRSLSMRSCSYHWSIFITGKSVLNMIQTVSLKLVLTPMNSMSVLRITS